jgi:hypothetical protein
VDRLSPVHCLREAVVVQLERRIDLTMGMKIEAALPPLTEVQDADQSKQE